MCVKDSVTTRLCPPGRTSESRKTGPIKLMGGPCWLEHVSTTSLCELSHVLMRAQLLNLTLHWVENPDPGKVG